MATDYPIQVNFGLVYAASFSASIGEASAFPIITTNHIIRELLISNSLDQPMVLTLGGVSWIALPVGSGGAMDGIQVYIPAGVVLAAYPPGPAPTDGFLSLSGI